MASKYRDTRSVVQVLGNILRKPSLLEDAGTYFFRMEDFTEEFHRVVFGAASNLYHTGATELTPNVIDSYLKTKPQSYAVYKANKGNEWVTEVQDIADWANFDYYYNRMKKMTLLRGYEDVGLNLDWLYDPDEVFDRDKRQKQETEFDQMSLLEIADEIDKRVTGIRSAYVDNATEGSMAVGDGLRDYINSLGQNPDYGPPMYGPLINAVTRGARQGTFYLRSAPTGTGKTRSMIADACCFACDSMYNVHARKWVSLGDCIPTLYISVEQEGCELWSMMVAFISGVNETSILSNKYTEEEYERVQKAIDVLERSALRIETLPDYSLRDVENIIKSGIRQYKTQMVAFDYVATSMKILEEISHRSGGVSLREDNILFLMSSKLKDIATQFGVFILSSTQVNANYMTTDTPDQNLLRGRVL